MRVAVLDLSSVSWAAGGTYSRMLMLSLVAAAKEANVEICGVTKDGVALPQGVRSPFGLVGRGTPWRRLARRARVGMAYRACQCLHEADAPPPSWWGALQRGIDVLLPVVVPPKWACGVPLIGWIPDFQQLHLPWLFPTREIAQRDRDFRRIIDGCSRVIVSSEDCLKDFRGFDPGSVAKASVHPFPSLFAFDAPAGPTDLAVHTYNLPEKYALIINQVWAHKNHIVVVRALDVLRQRGKRLLAVMPGLPCDYRDPQNSHLSQLLQEIARLRLHDQVMLLGRVSLPELSSLVRSCTVLIQPSLFEGWNTSVQDARALGRPVICSDIAIHREQAPDALGFFGVDDPAALADILERHWDELPPGPDARAENAGIEREKEFAAAHGRKLLQLCHDTAEQRK